jgi:hypothetical protein
MLRGAVISGTRSASKSGVFPELLVLDTLEIGLYKPRTFRQAVSFKHQSARLAPRWTKLKRCL